MIVRAGDQEAAFYIGEPGEGLVVTIAVTKRGEVTLPAPPPGAPERLATIAFVDWRDTHTFTIWADDQTAGVLGLFGHVSTNVAGRSFDWTVDPRYNLSEVLAWVGATWSTTVQAGGVNFSVSTLRKMLSALTDPAVGA